MRNYLTIAGRDSRDFGVYISGQGTFSAPEKAYQFYEVPGRNGDIIGYDHRLMNIEVSYECFIYTNFNQNIADFRTFLLSLNGYQRLTDSYHPDEYRMAAYVGPFEPEVTSKNNAGAFTLTFNCKPQRYLYSGEASYTWVPGGDQEITGAEIFVYTPKVDQTYMKWRYNYHGMYNINNPHVPYAWNTTKVAYSTLNSLCFAIDGVNLYAVHPTISKINLIYPTHAELDLTGGMAKIYAARIYLPTSANWYQVGESLFRAEWNLLNETEITQIYECNWFTPVESVADLNNQEYAICYDSPYWYIKHSGYVGQSEDIQNHFRTFINNWRSTIEIDVQYAMEINYPLEYAFVPIYPEPTCVLSESGVGNYYEKTNGHKGKLAIKYTGSDSMSNPTMFPSEPLIRVYGTGSFEMDGVTVTVSTCTSYTDIDCELMDCYEGSTNRNNAVSFSTYDFPKLQPGNNAITVNTGISAVEITPRWWQV